jgi:hypothetical protein
LLKQLLVRSTCDIHLEASENLPHVTLSPSPFSALMEKTQACMSTGVRVVYGIFFLVVMVLGFELRTSLLLGRHSTSLRVAKCKTGLT